MNSNNLEDAFNPGWLIRQFWRACGADARILAKCSYKEQVKYACLGGIVMATGIMAGLAGGFAFYTAFSEKGSAIDTEVDQMMVGISVVFGMLWGLMIFNLDRFIVSSTGQGDGTEAITKEEFQSALPRILLGIIIAVTISKPLEIRIFKAEIDADLKIVQMEKEREFLAQIDSIYEGRIQNEKEKMESWKQEIQTLEERYVVLENTFNEETGGGRGKRGYGPEAKKIEEQMKRMDKNILGLKKLNMPLINESRTNIKRFEAEKQKEINESQKISDGLDGLLERIKLAHEIAGFWITLFITLLFVAIELTPIFFKLMLIKSPYDYLLDNEDELRKAEAGIIVKHNYYQDKEGVQSDLVLYTKAEEMKKQKEKILKAQEELQEYAMQKWIEKEKEKIDENPELYVTIEKS